MRKLLTFLIVLSILCLSACKSSKVYDNSCKILHQGTFTYPLPNYEARVVINGNKHTEYHSGGKYRIESDLIWVNDCVMNLTITKVTLPNFKYNVGRELRVRIDSIRDNQIFYTSIAKDKTWNSVFQKID